MLNHWTSLTMSTSFLKLLPGKLDIKRHSPSILYIQYYTFLFILLDGDTADCPSGSGSCRKIKSGDKYIMQDVGELQQSLQRSTDKRLTLHYSTSADVEGCTTKPTTTINFICPERGGVRILFLDLPLSCQYFWS